MAAAWRYSHNGEIVGPVSASDLREVARSGILKRSDLVQKDGTEGWVPAGSIGGLFPAVEIEPPTASPEAVPASTGAELALPPRPRKAKPPESDFVADLFRAIIKFGAALSMIIIGGVAVVTAYQAFMAGQELTHLRSVGGGTIHEAYYQQMGEFIKGSMGLGLLMVVLLASIAYGLRRIATSLESNARSAHHTVDSLGGKET